MSFSFGNNAPGLGATSTPAKPTGGLGSFSFGGATANPAPAFGQTAPTASAPAFGATSTFGSTGFGATTSAPTLGGFGATTSAPTLGGFGTFGSSTSTTSAPTLGGFGSFGTNTATNSAPNMFGNTSTGFGGFGATSTTSTAPTFGGFGTGTQSSSAFGGFGAQTSTSSAPGFGGFGATPAQQPSFGGFSSFGSGFAKPATSTAPAFGGFGNSFSLGGPTQQQQQQQQQQMQQQQISPDEAFAQSIFNVSIYGDERDTIIAKWNYLQAMWGVGKSFYSQTAAPVDITPQNYLCRFKSMGYSRLPGKDNKMGLVALNFNKPLSEVNSQKQQIIANLNQIFGNKPNLLINIETMKEQDDKKSQIVIYIEEKSQMAPNDTKRILATDTSNYLNQPNIKAQLANMGIQDVLALVLPDEDQLKEYLENPPKGIDPRMWRQAKIDNPDPKTFIPVPMIGFHDLKWRIKCQEHETETHALYLNKVDRDLADLKQRHASTTAKIMEHKRKLAELSHKILKVVVKQECTRKVGLALSPEEEALRSKLENMQALVSAPTQFKGRLSELLSQMRMQRNQYAQVGGSEYTIDKDCECEMKSFLSMQQKAMEVLTETVNKDLKALQIIMDGMPELVRG